MDDNRTDCFTPCACAWGNTVESCKYYLLFCMLHCALGKTGEGDYTWDHDISMWWRLPTSKCHIGTQSLSGCLLEKNDGVSYDMKIYWLQAGGLASFTPLLQLRTSVWRSPNMWTITHPAQTMCLYTSFFLALQCMFQISASFVCVGHRHPYKNDQISRWQVLLEMMTQWPAIKRSLQKASCCRLCAYFTYLFLALYRV